MISLLFKFQVWFTIVWFWRDGFREILQLTVVALLRRPMRRDSVTLASGHAPPIYPSDFDLWQQTGQTEMTQEMTDSQIRTQFPNRNITDVPPNNIKWTNFDPVKEIKKSKLAYPETQIELLSSFSNGSPIIERSCIYLGRKFDFA